MAAMCSQSFGAGSIKLLTLRGKLLAARLNVSAAHGISQPAVARREPQEGPLNFAILRMRSWMVFDNLGKRKRC
jgi:hypothetical protein